MLAVPNSLRNWFVVHFFADIIFAIPLLLFPHTFLTALGWYATFDPVTPRLVGAALLGIGIESLLGRNASLEVFRSMLNLKIIWSGSAIIAFLLAIFSSSVANPPIVYLCLGIFTAFCGVWSYYRYVLR